MNAKQFSIPKKCPRCNRSINLEQENILGESIFSKSAEMAFRCPHDDCRRFFIGFFRLKSNKSLKIDNYFIELVLPVEPPITIPPVIDDISPAFRQIYYESLVAKESGLLQICGAGFRKALEFLVKDYAKNQVEVSEHKRIEEMRLSNVVSSYLQNDQVKTITERAVWLGNDATHYIRKWEGKDIDDLLLMIELTIQWINIDNSSRKFTQEMPKSKAT
jgi:hypothetical protein